MTSKCETEKFNAKALKKIKGLIKSKKDINKGDDFGRTLLSEQCVHGNTKAVQLLLDNGADVNAPSMSGMTPLMWAAMHLHVDIVELLIKHNAKVNLRTLPDEYDESDYEYKEDGFTALMHVCYSINPDNTPYDDVYKASKIIKMLIAAGADVNLKSDVGMTAFMLLIPENKLYVYKYLIQVEKITKSLVVCMN